MSEILLYISIISAILVVSLLILSILGLSDSEELSDFEPDSGDLGVVKSLLIFLTTGAWMTRSMLDSGSNPLSAILIGVIAGGASVYILSKVFTWLLRNQESKDFDPNKFIGETATVYLTIKPNANGIIRVPILGTDRDMDAISDTEIPTGSLVKITDYVDEKYTVELIDNH
jgi:membrane-bound ClpP family serine protease